MLEKTLWESLGLQGDPNSPSCRRSVLNIHWKDWCWSWSSSTLATWCEELTHLKRPWCWERLKVGGEGDNGGWDGWMASLTQWTWVWVSSGSCWWTGKPGVLESMGSQRVWRDCDWTEVRVESLSRPTWLLLIQLQWTFVESLEQQFPKFPRKQENLLQDSIEM